MALDKCPSCKQRGGEKPISCYFSWYPADGHRRAYKAKLCRACFVARVAPLDIDYAAVETLTCPQCGIDTEGDHDMVWVSNWIPKYGQHEVEAPFCNACAAQYRVWVIDVSEPLESREGASGPLTDHPSGQQVLADLGLRWRDNAAK